jgi:hypothetical protein
MDPNATLTELRELAAEQLADDRFGSEERSEARADRMANLIEALDQWLSRQGHPPKPWATMNGWPSQGDDEMPYDLRALLDYVQPDEEKDFERLEEGNDAESHIVHRIRRLRERVEQPGPWPTQLGQRLILCGAVGSPEDGEFCHLTHGHGGPHTDGDSRWE